MKKHTITIENYTEIKPDDIDAIIESITDLNEPVKITVVSKDDSVKSTTLYNINATKTSYILAHQVAAPIYVLIGLKERRTRDVLLSNCETLAIPLNDVNTIMLEKHSS